MAVTPKNSGESKKDQFGGIIKRIDAARSWFDHNHSSVDAAAAETLKWLQRNTRYYQQDGNIIHRPWWPSDLPETNDDVLSDTREFAFRCHLYDNGLRHMMQILFDKDIGYPAQNLEDLPKHIEFAVDYPAMGLHHELVGYRSAKTNKTLTLADVARRFGISNPVKVRDARIVAMAELGMWNCRADTTSYSISIGDAAHTFHIKAFIVLMRSFDSRTGKF